MAWHSWGWQALHPKQMLGVATWAAPGQARPPALVSATFIMQRCWKPGSHRSVGFVPWNLTLFDSGSSGEWMLYCFYTKVMASARRLISSSLMWTLSSCFFSLSNCPKPLRTALFRSGEMGRLTFSSIIAPSNVSSESIVLTTVWCVNEGSQKEADLPLNLLQSWLTN